MMVEEIDKYSARKVSSARRPYNGTGQANGSLSKTGNRGSVATLPQSMVPSEMRIPYILSGYRRTHQPWSYYLSSIFHIHNETFNIWTHLIGSLLMIFQIYVYYTIYKTAESDLIWTLLGYGFCAVSALICSTIAHLIHSKSRHINYTVFMFDYLGVCFWIYGTGIMTVYGISDPGVYLLVKDHYLKWQCFCTLLNYINICAAKLWYGHDLGNPRRTIMMVGGIGGHFTMNSIPFSWRYYKCFMDQECQFSSLSHISSVVVMFAVVAILFTLRQPEKTWPGHFDIIGGSHQLFHVAVIFAQTMELSALYTDFLSGANQHCRPNISEITIDIGTIAGVGLIVLVVFRSLAFSHLKDS